MMQPRDLSVSGAEPGTVYTVYEVSELCDVTLERVVAFVEFGVLHPQGRRLEEWRFPSHAILQARRAQRLQRDLELDLAGLALVMELLEDIAELRREVLRLRAQLARFSD